MTTFSPEVQEILDRVRRGEEKPKRKKAPKSHGPGVMSPQQAREDVKKRAPNLPNSTSFTRVYDYDLMVQLFTDLKMPIGDIAEYVGCSRSVVTQALNEAEVDLEDRLTQLKPQEWCKRRLHLMEEHAVQKGTVRTCGPCQTMTRKIGRFRRSGKTLTADMVEFLEI